MNSCLRITVPATSANVGPGFDSIGVALNRYLILEIEESDEWKFIPQSDAVASVPTNKENLIYQTAARVANEFGCLLPGGYKVKIISDIPMARGLGSSAAAIVAGIELANELCQLGLSKKDKLRIASRYEGHPDNVGAALFGGMVIGCHLQDDTHFIHIPALPNIEAIVVIPPYELKTKDARSVLPNEFSYANAVEASAVSNVLVASLLTGDWDTAGKMMDRDLFHQPYRSSLISRFTEIRETAKSNGAFGVAISGAGPTVICFAEEGNGDAVTEALKRNFSTYDIQKLRIVELGCHTVRNEYEEQIH
jgi:homoserine kinase